MKKNHTLILFALFVLFLATSCGDKGAPATATTTTTTAENAPATPTKPEVILYAARYNGLQMRETPELTGKVVTKVNIGDFVEGSGEVSPNKVKATLGGADWDDPFYKVTGLTPEQYKGWLYKPGLLPVYKGSRSDSPDLGKLTQFATLLKGLDVKKMGNGKKAWDFVTANFSDAKGSLADAVVVMLQDFLFQMEIQGLFYTETEKIKWATEDYEAVYKDHFDMNKYPYTKILGENGFRLGTGEGMIFPLVDWKKIQTFFNGKTTPAMSKYLTQVVFELLNPASEDGGLVITRKELADRIAFWNRFNKENPYFVADDAKINSSWMEVSLINGMDNTPSFDYTTKVIDPEAKEALEYYMKTYPDTDFYKTVKEFTDLCAKEGWKLTENMEKYRTDFANKSND